VDNVSLGGDREGGESVIGGDIERDKVSQEEI